MNVACDLAGNKLDREFKPSLIAVMPGQQASHSLITPPGSYHSQDELVISTNGQELRIRPDSLIESTIAFDQFTYTVLKGGNFS